MKKFTIFINSLLNALFFKKKNRICFYGFEQLNDNTRSLIEYINKNKGYNQYEVILVSKSNPIAGSRVIHVNKKIIGLFYLYRSNYIFHAQGMGKATFKSFYGQKIINIWHGTPLKSIGNNIKSSGNTNNRVFDNFCIIPSNYFNDIYMSSFHYKKNQLIVAGNPRNDYLYEKVNLNSIFNLSEIKNIILFMPTFRKSNNNQYNDSSIDIPIFKKENIIEINNKLKKLNQYLIFKPHPYQIENEIFSVGCSNIKVISDGMLDNINLRLYTLIGNSDALITDYSSVFFDYLLVDKPIGFTIEDINEYYKKRGFSVKHPEKLMPGRKILTKKDLFDFLTDLSERKDEYSDSRIRINKLVNSYKEKENSKYLLEKFDIKEER